MIYIYTERQIQININKKKQEEKKIDFSSKASQPIGNKKRIQCQPIKMDYVWNIFEKPAAAQMYTKVA